MSAIASTSSTGSPYLMTEPSGVAQIVQDFDSIGNALQSGNVSAAINALSAFQQDLQGNSQTSTNQPFGTNSKAKADIQSLSTALQTGDVSAARQAYASLKTDVQSAQNAPKTGHGGHHHHQGAGGTSNLSLINSLTTSSTTTTTTAVADGTNTSTSSNIEAQHNGSILNVTA
jgi:soluble cytochrome b562